MKKRILTYISFIIFLVSYRPIKEVSEPLRIAVLDSGYDGKNSAKMGVTVVNYDKEDNVGDQLGHGTRVINIIREKNKLDKIYSLKVLDDIGRGNRQKIKKAISWCIQNKIDIVNISFSYSADKDDLKDAFKLLHNNNILIIASFDNKACQSFPVKYDYVVGVSINPEGGGYLIKLKNKSIKLKGGNKQKYQYNSYATAYITGHLSKNKRMREKIRSRINE